MLIVGGPFDGRTFYEGEWPIDTHGRRRPLPLYNVYFIPPLDVSTLPEKSSSTVTFQTHLYESVPICWPSGSIKGWVLMERGLSDAERRRLLLERDLIDG